MAGLADSDLSETDFLGVGEAPLRHEPWDVVLGV